MVIFITLALIAWIFCVYKALTTGKIKEVENGNT